MSFPKHVSKVCAATLGFFCLAAMIGCGISGTASDVVAPDATTAALGTIQGSNFGGHAPITGANVFVLEATTNGYGTIAKSLLTSASANPSFPTHQDTSSGITNGMYYVQTDSSGSFNISGDYQCDVGQPVYLYAAGGSPSTTAPAPNAAIVNLAMLGLCTSARNFSYLNFVFINEISTIATAYSMAGFATDSLHIGSSSTNLVGLQNAALNASILYNIQGNGPGSTTSVGEGHIANSVNPNNSSGTVPQRTINTLGNIVASCVDSGNTTVGTTPTALAAESAQCQGLFLSTTSNGVTGNAKVGGATIPIDTATAMINLAHYPAGINTYPANSAVDSSNPSTLFGLPTTTVPFAPQLPAPPTDWTIALTYTNIPTPNTIAIDSAGDAYIGTYSATAGYIIELSPQGALTATSTTSVPNLAGLGISTASAIWATSNSNGQLYKFSSTLGTASTFTSAETSSPTALAVDSSGNVYVVNNSANYKYYYLSEFNSAGTVTYYTSNYQFSVSNSMALAASGKVWVTSTNNTFGLYPNPSTGNGNSSASGGFNSLSAIAVDYLGNAWITGKATSNQSLVRSTSSGSTSSYGTNSYDNTAIGGINNPVAVAVDGSNVNNSSAFNVWLANSGNNTVSEINSTSATSALSPSVGYQSGTGLFNSPSAIAADNAGNVWVANQGNSTVTEIIGSSTPVATPLAAMAPGVAP